ncbi:hypothetical protein KCU90_g948, partial [Aureobasidium melanogenum]
MPARSFGTTLTDKPSINPHGIPAPTPIVSKGAIAAWLAPSRNTVVSQYRPAAAINKPMPEMTPADIQRPAGLDFAVTVGTDKTQRQHDEQHDVAVAGRDRQHLHADKTRIAEQRQIKHGPRDVRFDDPERAALRGLNHAEREARQRPGERSDSRPVDTPRIRVARFTHLRHAEQQREYARHGARREDRSPTEALDHEARQHGPECQPKPEGRAEQTERAGARAAVELLGKSRSAARQRGRGGNTLHRAQQIDGQDRRRKAEQQRDQRESADTDRK